MEEQKTLQEMVQAKERNDKLVSLISVYPGLGTFMAVSGQKT